MLDLSKAELACLKKNELALFEDRIILDAQPPIDDDTLAEIAARCSGPIPEGLIRLWKVSFGGTLDYDLRVSFAEHEARASFSELFYPESDGYHDLWGWIDHEAEIGELEKLDHLPFGGFEYLVRFYVQVKPGPDHGAVFVWMKGLPPAWRLRLHADSVARVADDVPALFRELCLESDPTLEGEHYVAGSDLHERVQELSGTNATGRSVAEKLNRLIAATVLDFRASLDSGSIVREARLRRMALEHSADKDDVVLLSRLAELGCDLDEALTGGGTTVDHALARGSLGVVTHLLGRGVSVTNGLRNGAPFATLQLVKELLARGAEPDFHAVLSATAHDQLAGACEIATALIATDEGVREELIAEAGSRAEDDESGAVRIESGQMFSNETPMEYRARAGRYHQLIAFLRATLT